MAAIKRKERDVRHIQERPKRLIQQRFCRLLDRFLSPSLYGCSTFIVLPSPPELALFFFVYFFLFFFFSISSPNPPPSGILIVSGTTILRTTHRRGKVRKGRFQRLPQCLYGTRSPEKKLWGSHTYVKKTPDNTQNDDRRD